MIRTTAIGLFGLAISVWAGPTFAQPANPYAGQETREIKVLSPKEVDDLGQGRGTGLAKAAELNRYPGLLHASNWQVSFGYRSSSAIIWRHPKRV